MFAQVDRSNDNTLGFNNLFPSEWKVDGDLITFEIKLNKLANHDSKIIRATVLDTGERQDRLAWRAVDNCERFRAGERIEKWNVAGWREIAKS